MKLFEILKVAIAAIWAHKLRSALTLLGMIVGVTAFVTVVSLIQGFNVYIDEKIAGIGAKSFSVQRFNPFEDFKDTDTIAAGLEPRRAARHLRSSETTSCWKISSLAARPQIRRTSRTAPSLTVVSSASQRMRGPPAWLTSARISPTNCFLPAIRSVEKFQFGECLIG
ncbi:MAG: hypothetical protein DMF76_06580 [Acidobacteria bacterium]|nr:MAG: hypothetical protein DMF76_06580 [Acidobacteriota bacterium]